MNNKQIIDYEGSEYQKEFWEQGGRDYEDAVETIALRRLLPSYGKRMLELGAGAGRNTPKYQGHEEVVLLDYSRSQLELAQKYLGKSNRFRYIAADVYQLPFSPAIFDSATMIRTIHHLSDAKDALLEVHSVLIDNGSFILEFANKRNLKAMFRYLLGKQKWNPHTLDQVEFVKLNFNFHPQQIRKWLDKCNFQIQKQLSVSHFRVNFLKRVIPTKLLAALDSILQWTGSFIQVTPSVFIKSKNLADDQPDLQPFSFRCPKCNHFPIADAHANIKCPSCGTIYPYKNGIYDFRLDK